MHVIGWKTLCYLFCLPIILILSLPPLPLHGETEEAWEVLESEHFLIYYQLDGDPAPKLSPILPRISIHT